MPLISKKTSTGNARTSAGNVVHDFLKREGACLDIHAQTTVIGLKQALANWKFTGIWFELNKSQKHLGLVIQDADRWDQFP